MGRQAYLAKLAFVGLSQSLHTHRANKHRDARHSSLQKKSCSPTNTSNSTPPRQIFPKYIKISTATTTSNCTMNAAIPSTHALANMERSLETPRTMSSLLLESSRGDCRQTMVFLALMKSDWTSWTSRTPSASCSERLSRSLRIYALGG